MSDQKIIYKEIGNYNGLSLKQLLREAEDYCYENNFPYDERKIIIDNDYSGKTLLWYREKDE